MFIYSYKLFIQGIEITKLIPIKLVVLLPVGKTGCYNLMQETCINIKRALNTFVPIQKLSQNGENRVHFYCCVFDFARYFNSSIDQ